MINRSTSAASDGRQPEHTPAASEARAMKVPARYEAKKAEYLKMVDGFMAVLRMTMRFAKPKSGQ